MTSVTILSKFQARSFAFATALLCLLVFSFLKLTDDILESHVVTDFLVAR